MENSNSTIHTLNFINTKRPSVQIEGETFAKALEVYAKVHKDLQYADLRYHNLKGICLQNVDLRNANLLDADLLDADLKYTNLRYANLQCVCLQNADLQNTDLLDTDLKFADLQHANLQGVNLQGANLDFSTFPLSNSSLSMKIDKQLFCQLLYHIARVGQSVDDAEVKALLNSDEVLNLVNQFHRADNFGFGKIEKK